MKKIPHTTLENIGEEWREGGDLNPRVLADNGLAIHRLAGLGHLRFSASKVRVVINSFCMAFLDVQH